VRWHGTREALAEMLPRIFDAVKRMACILLAGDAPREKTERVAASLDGSGTRYRIARVATTGVSTESWPGCDRYQGRRCPPQLVSTSSCDRKRVTKKKAIRKDGIKKFQV